MGNAQDEVDYFTIKATREALRLARKHWWWVGWQEDGPHKKDHVELVSPSLDNPELRLSLWDDGAGNFRAALSLNGSRIGTATNNISHLMHEDLSTMEYLIGEMRRQAGSHLKGEMPTAEGVKHEIQSSDIDIRSGPVEPYASQQTKAVGRLIEKWIDQHSRPLMPAGEVVSKESRELKMAGGTDAPIEFTFDTWDFSISSGVTATPQITIQLNYEGSRVREVVLKFP